MVDGDAYLLQLSRYIHRNPVDGKRPLVTDLADYPWSSYPAYIGKTKASSWLYRESTYPYQMLGQKQRYRGYANYVMQGVDEQTARWYRRGNMAAIVGDKGFKSWVYEELLVELEAEERARVIHPVLSMEAIVTGVADAWDTTPERLTAVGRVHGRGVMHARWRCISVRSWPMPGSGILHSYSILAMLAQSVLLPIRFEKEGRKIRYLQL